MEILKYIGMNLFPSYIERTIMMMNNDDDGDNRILRNGSLPN